MVWCGFVVVVVVVVVVVAVVVVVVFVVVVVNTRRLGEKIHTFILSFRFFKFRSEHFDMKG